MPEMVSWIFCPHWISSNRISYLSTAKVVVIPKEKSARNVVWNILYLSVILMKAWRLVAVLSSRKVHVNCQPDWT